MKIPSNRSVKAKSNAGFTLIELMVVIVIIGLLVGMIAPEYSRYIRNARCARTAAELRSLSAAFVGYQAVFGDFPPDSHLNLPPGMDEFINPAIWANGTPIGGTYNWEGSDTYGYAALSIFDSQEPQETFEILDSLIDDGDLATGHFRMINSRPTLMLFDNL
jgi:prepilin-type N-terminal cleavage/methylation domain-containing protein